MKSRDSAVVACGRHLLAAGETVFHILGPGQVKQAEMNPAARIVADRRLAYPAES